MTGAPGIGAPPAGAPPAAPDPTKRYQDLLFQESAGTISPQDANDLGVLRQSGRLAGLDAKLDSDRPTAGAPGGGTPGLVPFSPENKPWAGPDSDYAEGGILAPPTEPGRNFADSFTERMGYGEIPGEAPNTGSLADQAYRIINRGVGAFQSGFGKATEGEPGNKGEAIVRSPGGYPVDINLRPVLRGAGEALGWGNMGAAPGAAVEAATGSRKAGSAAEVATNLAPLAYGLGTGGARLLASRPAAVARQIGALESTIPELTEGAVEGTRRVGGRLLRETKAAQQASRPPADVARRSYTLANTPEPPGGPLGQPPGIAKLRTATRATGEPPIIRADVPTDLSAARNVAGNRETALVNFQKWVSKAEGSLSPDTQRKYLEKAMREVDTHFPGIRTPELDALRGAHQQLSELTTKLGKGEANVRRLKKAAGWGAAAVSGNMAVKSILRALSTGPGGPGSAP